MFLNMDRGQRIGGRGRVMHKKCSMPKQKSCHWGSQNLMSEAQEGPPQNQSSIIVLFCTCHVCVCVARQ